MPGVVVVGSINLDVAVGLGRRPEPGETVLGEFIGRFAGGKGFNQAVACHRSGAPARFCGQIGADHEGRFLREALVKAGLDDASLKTHPELPTAMAQIAALPGGENSIVVVLGANMGLDRARAARALEGADILLLQMEIDDSVVHASLSSARDRGIRTILNAAPAHGVTQDMLSQVDVLVANQAELAELGGLDAAMAAGPDTVVVTLGAEGARCVSRLGELVEIPAYEVDVRDTTGAGDAFCGTLAGCLAQGVEMKTALRRASAAGAITASQMGAQAAGLTSAAIDRVIAAGRLAESG